VVALRNTNPVQETRLCIACHPTHFSTRSEMIAIENGYPVRARQSLQFLIERLYNNPRPIYGKTDASWARMIHAPGNVLSRLAYITNKFDRQITGDRRAEIYRGISEFLKLYWPNIETPQPESNGNLPRNSGADLENAISFTADGILNPGGLRFPDECCRHKVLDLIGDLALLGRPLLGYVIAERAGHAMHAALVSRIMHDPGCYELLSLEELHSVQSNAVVA
jgi:hypothetical protein